MAVNQTLLHQFVERGFVRLPAALGDPQVHSLVNEARQLIAAAASTGCRNARDGPTLNNILGPHPPTQGLVEGRASWHVEHVFRYSEAFRQLTTCDDLLEVVQTLLGPDVHLLDDQLYWKPARVGGATYLGAGNELAIADEGPHPEDARRGAVLITLGDDGADAARFCHLSTSRPSGRTRARGGASTRELLPLGLLVPCGLLPARGGCGTSLHLRVGRLRAGPGLGSLRDP